MLNPNHNPYSMKKLVYLFVIGLFFIGCGPSAEEQAKAEEAAKEQVQEIADDIELTEKGTFAIELPRSKFSAEIKLLNSSFY